MDLLTSSLIGLVVFVVFVLLTAYFMKSTLHMNKEESKAKLNSGIEDKDNDSTKKDDGN